MDCCKLGEMAAFLRSAGFDLKFPFACVLPEGRLVCRRLLRLVPGKRLVAAGEWEGRPAVVKFFLDPVKGRRHFRREHRGLGALKRAGLAVPEVWLGKSAGAGGVSLLILEELPAAATLFDLWREAAGAEERRERLAAVVAVIAAHHRAGLVQSDIHWGNFLFSGGRVYTIDGDAVDDRGAGRELGREKSLASFALFLAEPGPGIDEHLKYLWEKYCVGRGWRPEAGEVERIAGLVKDHRFHKAEKFVAKAGRSCTAVVARRNETGLLLAERSSLTPELEDFLSRPDEFMAAGKVLKAGNSATVVKVRNGDRDLVVKRYNIKNFGHALKRGLRPSRAWHSWRNAQRLRWWGIATPKPLAMLESRIAGKLRSRAWFISEYVAGEAASDYLPGLDPGGGELAGWLEQFAELLKRLYELRITHGDFKATNFLCGADGRLYLIDLDALRSWKRPGPAFKKAVARDHRRLLANWGKHSHLEMSFSEMIEKLMAL